MLYEIINMSDPYTIEAKSLDVAFIACMFLGEGQYALRALQDGGEDVPLFLFGGCEKWCVEHLSEEFEAVVNRVMTDEAKRTELADCLDSCLIGHAEDREVYQAALDLFDDPAKREQYRATWLHRRRSSLNDIGGRAYKIAAKLRNGTKNPLKGNTAPQQVFSAPG